MPSSRVTQRARRLGRWLFPSFQYSRRIAAIGYVLEFEPNRPKFGARRAYRAAVRHFIRLRSLHAPMQRLIEACVEHSPGDVRNGEHAVLVRGHQFVVTFFIQHNMSAGLTPEVADGLLAVLTDVRAGNHELRAALETLRASVAAPSTPSSDEAVLNPVP